MVDIPIPEPLAVPDFEQPIGQPNPPIVTGPRIHIPELAPATVPLRQPAPPVAPPANQGGLTDFWLFVMIFVAFGLAALANALTDFLNWLRLQFLAPFLRSRTPPALTPEQVTQALTAPLGKAIETADPSVGGSFAQLGELAANVGHEIAANAQVAAQLADETATQRHGLTTTQATTAHEAAAARVVTHTQEVRNGQTATRLDELQTSITHRIDPELDALRHRIPELEKGLTTAWDEIHKHEELLGAAAMTATVGSALSRLGGGWIRCEANQLLGRANCGNGPASANKWLNWFRNHKHLLDAILSGVFDLAVLLNLCELVSLFERVANAMQPFIVDFSRGINDLARCRNVKAPPELVLASHAIPPNLANLPL